MRLKSLTALVLLASFSFASPAGAHDLLIDIDPAPAAVLDSSEFEAKLTFNNPLLVVDGEVNAEVATKLDGSQSWVNHEISVVGRELLAQIKLTESGAYNLRWKVVSSDGHPISGESTFTLKIDGASSSGDSTSPIVIAPSPEPQEVSEGGSMVGFWIGLAMVVLGVIFAPIGLIIRRRARS